ncbi:hypothetical protein CASFOL_000494 [Castilleja foliolosa]|uniref:Uncharacterized protein n=1 Tax=Castilleja foliolosa TaxID=1961234 RepID=A0ABD3ENV0_9LAMI
MSPEEIVAYACDKNPNRLDMARLYNEISGIVTDNNPDSAEAYNNGLASSKLKRNLGVLDSCDQEINKLLSSVQPKKVQVGDMDTENPTGPNHEHVPGESLSNGTMDVEMKDADYSG